MITRYGAVDGLRGGEPLAGQFATDSLPLEWRGLQFDVIGAATFPLTFVEVRGNPVGHVIVDQDGEIVWYWQGQGKVGGGFARLNNGNFVFSDDNDLVVVTPAGQEVARMRKTEDMGQQTYQGNHHDMVVTPSNTVLFLAYDDVVVDNVTWTGEAVWEWDVETDVLTKRWRASDFLDPDVDVGPWSYEEDWLHANSLSIGPRGNVLLSLFWLDQVISIAPDYASLEWRLGGPGSTITVDAGVMLGGQHTATEIGQDRVLLFDNGRNNPEGPSPGHAVFTWSRDCPRPREWHCDDRLGVPTEPKHLCANCFFRPTSREREHGRVVRRLRGRSARGPRAWGRYRPHCGLRSHGRRPNRVVHEGGRHTRRLSDDPALRCCRRGGRWGDILG